MNPAANEGPALGEALTGAFLHSGRPLALVRALRDGTARIVQANEAMADLTARTGEGLVGADVLDVLGCGRRPEARDLMRGLVADRPTTVTLQSRLIRPDGCVRSIEIDITGAEGDPVAGRWVLAGARDITADVHAEESRRVREVVATIMAETASVQGAISALLPAVGDALGFTFGALWHPDAAGGELRCGAVWEAGVSTTSFAALTRGLPLGRGEGIPGRAWADAAAVSTGGLSAEPDPRAGAAAQDELTSAVAFPVFVGSELHAVLELATPARREVGAPLLSLLDDLGTEIAGALARKQAQERSPSTTLLLVEDNAFIARLVAEMLSAQGMELELVHVALLADARETLAASRPACVLLDLTLPDASGLESLEEVRAAAPDVPVVVLTGTEDEELAVRAVQQGAQDYLVKRKVDLDGLGRAIRYAIERKTAEQQVLQHELTDRLTGLPKRVLFTDRVRVALARAQPGRLTVLVVNLDRFRLLNDSLGYEWGDRLLLAAAQRIVQSVPPGASVASFGGDEFALLLEDTPPQETLRFAQELAETISAPYELGGEAAHVTATVGVATNVGDGCTAEILLGQADTALSRGKEYEGPRCEVFDESLREELRGRLGLLNGLRAAVEDGQLRLHYQPLVSLAGRRLVGFEALVRWQHPERGLLPPGEFLPLAEETGVIVPVGRWAVREAVRQIAAWDAEGLGDPALVVHVNLSARELAEPDLVDSVKETLRAANVGAERLCLEVTETALVTDLGRSARALSGLRELGVSVALDDFGTGYSSLSYLERFPITVLKLDRSFVSSMGIGGKQAIVSAVASMAAALEIPALAEGIETEQELEQLRALGYDLGQGWLFGRPVPPEKARDLLAGVTQSGPA